MQPLLLVALSMNLTVAAGAVVLRAVLLYAGSGGGGLGLRVVVWNNNVPATANPFHYSGQVLLPTVPRSWDPTDCGVGRMGGGGG